MAGDDVVDLVQSIAILALGFGLLVLSIVTKRRK